MVAIAVIFSMISMLFCVVVSSTIFFNKELRETHPSMLICIMSLAEFITCYNALIFEIGTVDVVCYLGLN